MVKKAFYLHQNHGGTPIPIHVFQMLFCLQGIFHLSYNKGVQFRTFSQFFFFLHLEYNCKQQ